MLRLSTVHTHARPHSHSEADKSCHEQPSSKPVAHFCSTLLLLFGCFTVKGCISSHPAEPLQLKLAQLGA